MHHCQSALDEEVEPAPTQRAAEVLKSLKHVGSRWKAPQEPPPTHSLRQLPRQQQMQLPPVPSSLSSCSDARSHTQPQATGSASSAASVKQKPKAVEPVEIV